MHKSLNLHLADGFGVKIDVCEGGKQGFGNKVVNGFHIHAPGFCLIGKPGKQAQKIDQLILLQSHFVILAAHAFYCAAYAFGSLFALIAKHSISFIIW
jgi:hypothetical protein